MGFVGNPFGKLRGIERESEKGGERWSGMVRKKDGRKKREKAKR